MAILIRGDQTFKSGAPGRGESSELVKPFAWFDRQPCFNSIRLGRGSKIGRDVGGSKWDPLCIPCFVNARNGPVCPVPLRLIAIGALGADDFRVPVAVHVEQNRRNVWKPGSVGNLGGYVPRHRPPILVEQEEQQIGSAQAASANGKMGGNKKVLLTVMVKVRGPDCGPSEAARLRSPDAPRIAFPIPAFETECVAILGRDGRQPEIDRFLDGVKTELSDIVQILHRESRLRGDNQARRHD